MTPLTLSSLNQPEEPEKPKECPSRVREEMGFTKCVLPLGHSDRHQGPMTALVWWDEEATDDDA